ncbi:MAG: NAD(+) synthase, partial [Muribaculaceae bacterium]|nr:NAD(+) synthase [Muribaculaceae bacterium]
VNSTIYNCGLIVGRGRIYGAVPKTYIPNYNEFYEKRWWASGHDVNLTASIGCYEFPLTTAQIFEIGGVKVGMEICEDLWTPIPPSSRAALAGAEIIINLSASNDLIGKYAYLSTLICQQSARCICAYVYAGAGFGESTTDLVFDGKSIIAENGNLLQSGERWTMSSSTAVADIDIEALRRDRMHLTSFHDCSQMENVSGYTVIRVSDDVSESYDDLLRTVNPMPFVPANDIHLNERCGEIVAIQVEGLARRLSFTHTRSLVVGISGGLDSTLALLVACRTFDRLCIDRSGIIGVTMPGFGTTDRTYNNAMTMMQRLGVTIREVSIVPAVKQHFSDIGHDTADHDVTYENSQARERTQILMDIANQTNGMVLGTGDLSELALGWATYNGDHMSM